MAPTSSNRESVGWFADLAANQTTPQHEHLPSMVEENEEEPAAVPQIQVETVPEADPMQDVDLAVGEFKIFIDNLSVVIHTSVRTPCAVTVSV